MKSEKGYTGVDIAIAIVVLFTLVSIIAILAYNFNSTSKEIELKTKATEIAIEEIEAIKNIKFEDIKDRSVANGTSQYFPEDTTKQTEEVAGKQGFFKRIIIEDYTDFEQNKDKNPGLVKKITVQIRYMFKGKEQTVELSTILSKES